MNRFEESYLYHTQRRLILQQAQATVYAKEYSDFKKKTSKADASKNEAVVVVSTAINAQHHSYNLRSRKSHAVRPED